MNSEGYVELIQGVGRISQEPQYRKSFEYLVYEVLEFKNWKQNDLEKQTGMQRKTLYNHIYGISNSRNDTIKICLALGLDLVSTMIFLMSKGYILNFNDLNDRKTMKFIDTNKSDSLTRIIEFTEFMEK